MNLVDAFCYSSRTRLEDAGTECFQRVLLVDVCVRLLLNGCFRVVAFSGFFSMNAFQCVLKVEAQ